MPSIDSVTVVVPSWKRPEMLRECLRAIVRLDFAPSSVVVVARPDDTETHAVLEEFAAEGIRLVAVHRPGNMAPIQAGLAATTTPLIAIVDDDAVPRPDWLGELLAPFSDGTIACVGGHAPTPHGRPPKNSHPGRSNWFGRMGVDIAQVATGPIHDVETVQECNWAWRTSVLRTLPFDVDLDTSVAPNYGLDLTLSARGRGWRVVYNPRAIVDHFSRSPAGFDAERARAYSRNITLITLKHRPLPTAALFLAWAMLVGDRGSPGLAVAAADFLGGRRSNLISRMRAAYGGRFDAVETWLTRRRGGTHKRHP